MARTRTIIVGACALLAVLESTFLKRATLEAAPSEAAERSNGNLAAGVAAGSRPAGVSHPRRVAKVPEIIVPPPPPPPAARKSSVLRHQRKFNKSGFAQHVAPKRLDSTATTPVITAVAYERAAPSASLGPKPEVRAPDPEAVRIQDELRRVRDDAEARRAFYDDLRRTVERVRGGAAHEDLRRSGRAPMESQKTSAQPAQPQNSGHDTSASQPATHPEEIEPAQRVEPGVPQARISPSAGGIDRTAYVRVVRWANANGAPVQLALAVAWMESHLNANAPRGGAGEVGMFQIMPARCVTEGWPARRLNEPEFNAWMGTLLLARYYQEEGSVARAAAKYVAGPGVFNKSYSKDVWAYINWYASTVDSYATYFSRYQA